jgi:TRAP-type C4-dicarboxylate transport system permease small subunit
MMKINLIGEARPRFLRWRWNPLPRIAQSIQQIRRVRSRTAPVSAAPTQLAFPSERRPSLHMLADLALRDDAGDKLGFKSFANAMAGIIDSPRTTTPLVMAINAHWGGGKTTLGQMIKRRLETKSAADSYSPHVTCWFGAWMHDDAPTLSTALAAEVAKVAGRSRSLWRRMANPLPSILSTASERKLREGFKYLAVLVLMVLVCVVVLLRQGYGLRAAARLNPEVARILSALSGSIFLVVLTVLALIILFRILATLLREAKSVGGFAKDPQAAAQAASMPEVRSELGKLIKQATPKGSRFVVFIDDLDRCRPPRSVEVLEAVNQLLDHAGVVVVLMSDMQVLAKCAEMKFKDLAKGEVPEKNQSSADFSTNSRNFLQKIIQLQLDLPIYSARKIRQMVGDFAKEVPKERTRNWLDTVWQGRGTRTPGAFAGRRASRNWASGIFYLLVVLAIGWGIWKADTAPPEYPVTGILTETATIVLALFLVRWLLRILARMRESGRRRQIDQQIKARTTAGERDFSKVEAYVRGENSAWRNDPEMEGLVTERLQRYLEDESELQLEAEDEVMQYLEPMPRHAKRLLNRLRLLLFIAHERRMLGGKPELSSRHVGKWAVLGERWPELLQAVCLNPDIMKPLEDSETHDAVIKERAPLYQNDEALRRFCFSRGGLKLWPVVKRMVEFVPSTDRRVKSPAS